MPNQIPVVSVMGPNHDQSEHTRARKRNENRSLAPNANACRFSIYDTLFFIFFYFLSFNFFLVRPTHYHRQWWPLHRMAMLQQSTTDINPRLVHKALSKSEHSQVLNIRKDLSGLKISLYKPHSLPSHITHSLHTSTMSYKTNYEPYVSRPISILCISIYTDSEQNSMDFDMERERSSEEVLYPLIDLYPHVVALQLQADGQYFNRSDSDSGYHSVNYWTDSSPTRSTFEEESRMSRKSNGELSSILGDYTEPYLTFSNRIYERPLRLKNPKNPLSKRPAATNQLELIRSFISRSSLNLYNTASISDSLSFFSKRPKIANTRHVSFVYHRHSPAYNL